MNPAEAREEAKRQLRIEAFKGEKPIGDHHKWEKMVAERAAKLLEESK